MHIIDLTPNNERAVRRTAELLFESFCEHWPRAWPTIEAALEEVRESFAEDRVSRIAVDDDGNVIGWVGGISQYDGRVWELHPIAVSPAHRRKGIGRALVADLEERVKERGGITLTLGTDDEDNQTTLGGIDLYPDVWKHINAIRNLNDHPYEFYRKLGFVIVGVMPDANGLGKPDIYMAKRIGK
ncbi:MAG TPA: GNAT family N-acetyltransferase [Blastocatellia bacterium]|nr:GNAT family N-acetyltransferase [Blastocatellia bacterium]